MRKSRRICLQYVNKNRRSQLANTRKAVNERKDMPEPPIEAVAVQGRGGKAGSPQQRVETQISLDEDDN